MPQGDNHNFPDHLRCTGKNRQGARCQKKRCEGSTKCRFHGGKTPKKNLSTAKPGGIYSKYMTADDLVNYAQGLDELGKLDQEIAMTRVQLARVLKIRAEREALGDHMQIEEEVHADNGGSVKRRMIDYDNLIIRYTGRIESLEKARKELMAESNNDHTITIVGGLPFNAAQINDDDSGVTISTPTGI